MAVKSKQPEVSIPKNLSWPEFVFKDFEEYGTRTAIVSIRISRTNKKLQAFIKSFL